MSENEKSIIKDFHSTSVTASVGSPTIQSTALNTISVGTPESTAVPISVLSSTPEPPYLTNRLKNIEERRRKFIELGIGDKTLRKLKEKEESQRAPPRVKRVVPPLSMTTRQSAHSTKMVGTLDNLEGKEAIAREAKLAELSEKKQAMAKKKEQSRNPLEKLIGQDNVFRLFDKHEKSPQMGMPSSQSGQTPDQANHSFDSVSTLAGTETKAKNDESIVTDDFSLSSSSSEIDSPPKKVAKKIQKKPETKQLPPTKPSIDAVKPSKNKNKKSNKNNKNKKPVQCYAQECEAVFISAIPNLKNHFTKYHSKAEFDSSKVLSIKYMCYNCSNEYETYSLLEKHFAEKYPSLTLNPKKVFLGETMKSASVLLKLKLGPPPPNILKNLPPKVKKTVPTKTVSLPKKIIERELFMCSVCKYVHSDLENVKQHKILMHSSNKENMGGKQSFSLNLKLRSVCCTSLKILVVVVLAKKLI